MTPDPSPAFARPHSFFGATGVCLVMILTAAFLLMACGKKEELAPPPPPPEAADAGNPAAVKKPPTDPAALSAPQALQPAQPPLAPPAYTPPTAPVAPPTVVTGDPEAPAALLALTHAVRKYAAERQRAPASLSEVVAAGYVQLPKAPPGKKYVIERKRLEVKLENE